jgi:hypothetical protein
MTYIPFERPPRPSVPQTLHLLGPRITAAHPSLSVVLSPGGGSINMRAPGVALRIEQYRNGTYGFFYAPNRRGRGANDHDELLAHLARYFADPSEYT